MISNKTRLRNATKKERQNMDDVLNKIQSGIKTKMDNVLMRILSGIKTKDETETALRRRLNADIREAAKMLTRDEARYIIDLYYQLQDFRIQSGNQVHSLEKFKEPSGLIAYFRDNISVLEDQIKALMGAFADQYAIGAWLRSVCGIGPILSAAFLVTFSPLHRRTAGAWYTYAGIAPGIEWKKGEKRPFDARAKVLCYKAGESFIKVQNNDADFYGKLYASQKEYYQQQNEQGKFEENARLKLEKFKIGKTTDAYKYYSTGKLPPAHIHSMARRYAVKMFLSHMHDLAWEDYYDGEKAPCPYVFSDKFKGGVHKHFIEAPNREHLKGLPLLKLWGTEAEDLEKRAERERISKQKKSKIDE